MIAGMERREFLVNLLGIPAALLALEYDDPTASYEECLNTRWEIFHIGGTHRATRGIDRWMQDITNFTKTTRGTLWHNRALAVLCMSYQLKGDIWGDRTLYKEADAAYTRALTIAQELNDPELIAAALVRKGVILIGQKEPLLAIQTLNGALDTVQGRGFPTLKGNILQVLSGAYARLSST